jgi:2-polyprenyl-6-methoxyphenol hydroxylase-like FAD-dependent oxidoreductase
MKIVIAGGGIGGFSAALALARAGHDIEVVEQAAELRQNPHRCSGE